MIDRLQRELEEIYRLEIPYRVEDFVLGREVFERLRPEATAPEELLVLEEEGELSLGLYLADPVLERLASHDPDDPEPRVLEESLSAYTTALEGVSHFVYLAWRVGRAESVSLLDLELQAEVDKFVAGLLHLWRRGRKAEVGALWRRLFHEVSFRSDLTAAGAERYRAASALAARYCRRLLDRFLDDGSPEGLLREVRSTYRLGPAARRSHFALH